MRLDVVVVTHQNAPHVGRAIGALPDHAAVVVVDNASFDGTPARARAAGAKIVVENDVNAGFAAAANQGAALGTAEAILFLNPDAEIEWDALQRMLHVLERAADVAIVGPRIRYEDGTEQRSFWPFPSTAGAWKESVGLHRLDRRPPREGFVVGTCFLVRRDVFEALGGFDTRYWLYGEETDLCRRAVDAGWRIERLDGAGAHHSGGASGEAVPELVADHFARGGERYVLEHEGRGHLVSYRLANLVGATIRAVAPGPRERRVFHRRRARRYARALLSGPTSVAVASPATRRAGSGLVVCSLEAWDDVWRRNQFLVRELLALDPNLRVLFVEPAYDRLHRGNSIRLRTMRSVRADGRVLAFQPGKSLPRLAGPLADRSLRRQVRAAVRHWGLTAPTLWLNDVDYADLALDTGWATLYDVTDDWLHASITRRARRRLRHREQLLLAAADAVTVCSDELARTRGTRRADAEVIPNAADAEHFTRPRPRPADLPESPTAVYVGTLHDDRLDVALVGELAAARPDLQVVLVGPDALSTGASRELDRYPNVSRLGVRPYADVPAYLQHADVVIVPHVVTPFTESLDPIKAYECLAVGRPTVATPVAGFRGLGPPVRVAGRDAFVSEVAVALAIGGAAAPVPTPSWSERGTQFAAALARARRRHEANVAPRRIVFVDHCAQLSGGELALVRLLGAVQGIDCHVILGEHGPLEDRLRAAGATVEVREMPDSVRNARRDEVRAGRGVLRRVITTAGTIRDLRRRLVELRPDLVHTNSLKAAVYGGIAARLARVPVVWHIRDRIAGDYLPRQAVAGVKVLAMFVPRAIVFNSRATRDALRVPVSFSVIPSPVVYDGVATPVLPHSDGSPHPLRFTMLGRLAPWKGQHVFLRAFAAAFPAGRERAIVAGSAMFGEDDYAEELRRLAVRLGIAERVEFTGFVTDITALLDRSDVVVHASVVPEPFGQVVVEGMAAGLPVIATAAGGPLEIITGNVDGLLVPPDDASALARAMSRLAADPHLRHALGVAGQVRASDFTPARVAEITTELWAAVAHDAR